MWRRRRRATREAAGADAAARPRVAGRPVGGCRHGVQYNTDSTGVGWLGAAGGVGRWKGDSGRAAARRVRPPTQTALAAGVPLPRPGGRSTGARWSSHASRQPPSSKRRPPLPINTASSTRRHSRRQAVTAPPSGRAAPTRRSTRQPPPPPVLRNPSPHTRLVAGGGGQRRRPVTTTPTTASAGRAGRAGATAGDHLSPAPPPRDTAWWRARKG